MLKRATSCSELYLVVQLGNRFQTSDSAFTDSAFTDSAFTDSAFAFSLRVPDLDVAYAHSRQEHSRELVMQFFQHF